MCGIAGFVERRESSNSSLSRAYARLGGMVRTLEHRGPDDWGVAFLGYPGVPQMYDPAHVSVVSEIGPKVALGHRRLSILDVSAAGHQPMFSADSSTVITFNGEIYNFVELREELRALGKSFHTNSDTEVLLAAYQAWDVDMLNRLDGMYGFALWDRQRARLICARDPLGIKPFYYSVTPELFAFGSEPKAILCGLGSSGHMDASHVAEFVLYGVADHDQGTHFAEVKQLRGGEWIEIDAIGNVSPPRKFWALPTGELADIRSVPELIREKLDRAVHRQLRSDVPVGGCLSGGLDSGSLVSTIGLQLGPKASSFTTLTLQNDGFEGDETVSARATARAAGVNWIPVAPRLDDIGADLEKLVAVMGEPFSGLSIFGGYKIMEKASSLGLKVMIDGQGGDEVFVGYPRVARRVVSDLARQFHVLESVGEWFALRKNMEEPMLASIVGIPYSSLAGFRRRRGINRVSDVISRGLLENARPEVAEEMFSMKTTREAQIDELTRFCLPRLLRYEDRNSMGFGVEARVPLLSVDLVETAVQLPLQWKVRGGWTKYALRMAMENCLPEQARWNRRKRGFEVPQGKWVTSAHDRISSWLNDLNGDSVVDSRRLLARIQRGEGNAQWFWRLISVGLWIRSSGVRT